MAIKEREEVRHKGSRLWQQQVTESAKCLDLPLLDESRVSEKWYQMPMVREGTALLYSLEDNLLPASVPLVTWLDGVLQPPPVQGMVLVKVEQ